MTIKGSRANTRTKSHGISTSAHGNSHGAREIESCKMLESGQRTNIVFLGWGSLTYHSTGLKILGSWESDGPRLPIEFARISESHVLTLVLFAGASEVQTLWVRTDYIDIETAIERLAKRERTTTDNIGFVDIQKGINRCKVIPEILPNIRSWAKQKRLDGVVWTDLPTNFEEKTKMEFNEDNVVDYIFGLPISESHNAELYVRKAPDQVDTKLRRRIVQEFGWRSLTECSRGFWLTKNMFVMADNAEIAMVDKKLLGDPNRRVEKTPMLILTNAVEMTVNNNNKIIGVDKHPKFGLWLDTVNKAIMRAERTSLSTQF